MRVAPLRVPVSHPHWNIIELNHVTSALARGSVDGDTRWNAADTGVFMIQSGANDEPSETGYVPVVLVDDHEIWRDGMKSMLSDTEFAVVGEASSGRECIGVVEQTCPRIVILDVRMAGGDGFEALRTLKTRFRKISVLMLTTYSNPTFMARAVAGGASGYLLKGLKRTELISALRAVAQGDILLTREDLTHCLRCLSDTHHVRPTLIDPLTPREIEVLTLLATGLANRDIATILFISEGTAKTHVEHIISKLGVSDRVQAAVWAARNGMA